MSSEKTEQIDVRYVANLARIDISDDECAMFQKQLGSIIGYIDTLRDINLDTDDVENLDAIDETHLREDTCKHSLDQEDLLRNAPESAKGQIRVPKVVDA